MTTDNAMQAAPDPKRTEVERRLASYKETDELIRHVKELGLSGAKTINLPYDELREMAYIKRFGL